MGDPTILAWVVTITHLLASGLCGYAGDRYWHSSLRQTRNAAVPWFFATGFLLILGLNKQLDAHSWVTSIIREMARRDGWYQYRRTVQAGFVIVCAILGIVCTTIGMYALRRRWKSWGITFAGIVFLLTFVVIRIASLHHVDHALYKWSLWGCRLDCWLELTGSVLVCAGAWLAIAQANAAASAR